MTTRLTLAALTSVLAARIVLADPVVPGFQVTPYASVTDPTSLSFASDGTLYTGRDASGSGGGSGDAVKIHRIGAGGAPVEEFGAAALPDPDGVLVDETGALSGTAGAVLVCGADGLGQGTVSAIAPDQSITTVLGPTATLQNPNYMAIDSTGALLVSDSGGAAGVYRYPAGGPLAFFLDPGAGNSPDNLAVDATGRIFVHLSNGNVATYDAAGTLENAAFATGLGAGAALAVGPGGVWGMDLYAGVTGSGDLVRIDDQGMATTIGTGFTDITGIAFGSDGALYVAEFANDRILRVEAFSSMWQAASGSLPDEVCPAWMLVDSADPEDPVLAGGVLTLSTDVFTENMFYLQSGSNVSIPDPLVVEARLRFVSGGEVPGRTAPVAIAVTTAPEVGVVFFVEADHVSLTDSGTTEGPSATVDTDGAAHTYRLVVSGSVVQVFYDGVLTLTGSTYQSLGDHGGEPRVLWGEVSTGAFGTHEWEFVRDNAAVCVPTTTTTTSTTDTTTTVPTSTTTTTVPTTTSTSATLPSTTTTSTTATTSSSAPASTTSTTVPPAGCDGIPDGATFASLRCRLDALLARVNAESALGTFQPKLAGQLDRAIARLDDARTLCAESNAKKTRKRLQQTGKALGQYVHRLGSRPARKKLDDGLRRDFQGAGDALTPDTEALRAAVACPADAGA